MLVLLYGFENWILMDALNYMELHGTTHGIRRPHFRGFLMEGFHCCNTLCNYYSQVCWFYDVCAWEVGWCGAG